MRYITISDAQGANQTPRKFSKTFTLIELLVVIAILAAILLTVEIVGTLAEIATIGLDAALRAAKGTRLLTVCPTFGTNQTFGVKMFFDPGHALLVTE